MHRRLQSGMRENTAPSRQHASRLAISSSSSPEATTAVRALCECPFEVCNTEMRGLPSEPFVSADQAAQFLCVKRRYLLALARSGIAGAYPLGTGTKRKIWVFRLSELAASVMNDQTILSKTQKPCTIRTGSPRWKEEYGLSARIT